MSRPLKAYLIALLGSLAVGVAGLQLADWLGFFGGWPSVPKFLFCFSIGWACQKFARAMERRAERRESIATQ